MPDFGFVGGAYEAESIYQDAQQLINWYCEIDSAKSTASATNPKGDRGVIALYPTPGFTLQSIPGQSLPVRALHTLSGQKNMLAVIGSSLYSYNTSMTPTFSGYLNTTTGPVSISDNGIQAMIVDGANRYSYSTNGTSNAVFTGSIAAGVLTVTAVSSGTIVVGQILTGSGISTGTTVTVAITGAGGTGTYYVSVTNTAGSTTITGAAGLTTLPNSDGPFKGADVVDTVDNYFVFNYPGTQQFAASNALSTTTPALSFASKFSAQDQLVSIMVNNRIVYLLGEVTTEAWSDVGSFPFPFALIPGSTAQHGCAAKASVAQLGDSFAYVSKDLKGQGIIVMMNGYAPSRISTHAVEYSLNGQVISDAIAFAYQLNGHEFYVVTFPTADITWVFDLMTGKWHKWLSMDVNGNMHRHRSNCAAVFNGLVMIGDYQNGSIYSLSNSVYTENAMPIRRVRRCPHITSDLQRVTFEELQIQFQPGVGLQTGQGVTPKAMLRWSKDGGSTYSNEHWTSIGTVGSYLNRAIWRRMGMARDMIFEVSVSDPVNAVIVSANLKASVEES
jgi:hypothetical protein